MGLKGLPSNYDIRTCGCLGCGCYIFVPYVVKLQLVLLVLENMWLEYDGDILLFLLLFTIVPYVQ